LGVDGIFQLLGRTAKTKPGEGKAEQLVGVVENAASGGGGLVQGLPHADELTALPREDQRHVVPDCRLGHCLPHGPASTGADRSPAR
jgi:hypothetical protein